VDCTSGMTGGWRWSHARHPSSVHHAEVTVKMGAGSVLATGKECGGLWNGQSGPGIRGRSGSPRILSLRAASS